MVVGLDCDINKTDSSHLLFLLVFSVALNEVPVLTSSPEPNKSPLSCWM